MTGTIYTGDFIVTASFGTNAARDTFAYMSGFLDSHGGLTRIASSGSFGATGEPTESPELSYGVWRSVSSSVAFDIILRWGWNTSWPAASWRNGTSTFGLGILAGIHASGEAWSGTTTNSGDAVPLSPFKSSSIVYSRPNAIGGTPLAMASQNSFNAANGSNSNTQTRIIASGDNESVMFFFDNTNNNSWENTVIFSRYIPSNPNYNLPFMMFCGAANLLRNSSRGNRLEQANTGGGNGGLSYIFSTASSSLLVPYVESFRTDYITYQAPMPLTNSFSPNILEYPIMLIAGETGGECVGYLETIRSTYSSLENGSRINSGSRFVISGTFAIPTISIPWNGRAYATGTFYSQPSVFLTGSTLSNIGGLPIFVDRLGTTDAIIISQSVSLSTTLFRGFHAGNYVYSLNTPPSPATDIVVIRRS